MTTNQITVDAIALEAKVKEMYRDVALQPHGTFHFELGGPLARRLGYPDVDLSAIPPGAVESFAGVGYFFDLAALRPGERVLDLGSGSGTDAFLARHLVGETGNVIGIDISAEQLTKARRLADENGVSGVEFREGRIEAVPLEDASVDCVISNGVINLSPDKAAVFAEISRVLRPEGRLAIADIVSEHQLTDAIVANADLWASCIGGAAQRDDYRAFIEAAGMHVLREHDNDYAFLSPRARSATSTYGVTSISLLAVKTTIPTGGESS